MPTRGPQRGGAQVPCVTCGTLNATGAQLCSNCGKDPAAPAPAIGTMHAPMSRRTKIFIFLAVLLVLGAFGVMIYQFQNTPASIDVTNSAESNAVSDPVASINVIPGEEIPIACGLTVVVPDLKETTEQTFTNPQTGCSTTVRWVINNP